MGGLRRYMHLCKALSHLGGQPENCPPEDKQARLARHTPAFQVTAIVTNELRVFVLFWFDF